MSMINGEKARAAVNRKRRNARRVKDRARVAELRAQAGEASAAPAAEAKPRARKPKTSSETSA